MFIKTAPDWAKAHINPNECTIEKTTDGKFAVVDHSLQTQVGVGDNQKDCDDYLYTLGLVRSLSY